MRSKETRPGVLDSFNDRPRILFLSGWGEEGSGGGSARRMERMAACLLRGFRSKGRLVLEGRLADPGAGNLVLRVSTRSGLLGTEVITPITQTFDLPVKGRRGGLEVRFELAEEGLPGSKDGEPAMIVERIEVLTGKAASLPSVLEIESSTRCNINPPCVMCYPRIFDKRGFAGDIDEAAFSGLIPYLRGFRTISLHGVGEPLLGRKLAAILDHIDRERTWVQFNSNGLLLTEDRSRELVRKGLKMIDISLDAATPETYRKIRRSDLGLVVRNIERLSEIKRELRARHPVIKLNMTLMKENAGEIAAFVGLAWRLGAEIVHLGLLNPHGGYRVANGDFVFDYREQRIDPASGAFRAEIEAARERARSLGIELVTEFSGESR
jgi:molybdenum cofactor biosynthesis enzyme MoaA